MPRWVRMLPLCLTLVVTWSAFHESLLNGMDLSAGATLAMFGTGLAFCVGLGWLFGRLGPKR